MISKHANTLVTAAVPLLIVLTLGACSSSGGKADGAANDADTDGHEGDGGPIPLAELPARLISAQCAYGVRCNFEPSLQECIDSSGSGVGQLVADVASGKIQYDGAAAAGCADAIASRGCTFSSWGTFLPESCRKMFLGAVADGAPCFVGQDCISQFCMRNSCDPTVQCCAGTCAPTQTTVAAGSDCSSAGSRCEVDSFCQRDAIAGTATCVTKGGQGQPCSTAGECVYGLRCLVDPRRPTVGGACATLPARGEACDFRGVPACDSATDTCSPTTGTCVTGAEPGAACVLPEDCVEYAKCDPTTLKCVAKGSLGDACAGVGDCLGTLVCPGGVCTAPPPVTVCP